jgi:hypothetical protein
MNSEPWLGCWAELIGVGGVAYDIGANAGEWTRWLKDRFASVVSLEPDDRCEPPDGCRYDQRPCGTRPGLACSTAVRWPCSRA